MVASEKDYVATHIAHKLDLTGPALNIHTACSTSLVAVITAVQHLRAGFCEVAIAGGASLTVPQRSGHIYQDGGMLSRDGRTRSFDADASGTVFSDGGAMVVLKPLDRAIADGDTVHAVIRGVGLNNDGGHKASFTAPSVEGQAAVVAMAQDDAGISPRDIQYVEAHGTATPLGDPIEIEALSQAFRRGTVDTGFCGIGSIKSNLGHLTASAGVAGLIKVALSLENEELPPTVHYVSPNPRIAFEGSPFYVVATRRPWPRAAAPRRAGVSSFGVGGSNAHVVVEEGAAPGAVGARRSHPSSCSCLRGRRKRALEWSMRSGICISTLPPRRSLPMPRTPWRWAARALRRATRRRGAQPPPRPPRSFASLTRVFTAGQQRRRRRSRSCSRGRARSTSGWGGISTRGEALFRVTVDQCAEILRPRLGLDLRELLFAGDANRDTRARRLKRTEITQTALFTIEYALARTLMAWGAEPKALCGHSVGEFVAACLSGIFDLEGALGLVAARGQLMQDMPEGAMLGIRSSALEWSDCCPPLSISQRTTPLASAWSPARMPTSLASARRLQARGILGKLLETSHAFHSRSMTPAASRFEDEVRRVPLGRPTIPIVSTVTGTWLTDAQAGDVDYWAGQLRRTVRFSTALATLGEDPSRVLLEVGPRRTLTTFALQRPPGEARPTAVASLSDNAENDAEWNALLGPWAASGSSGVNVDFRSFFRGEKRRRIPLPGYSFERDRHWLDMPATSPLAPDLRASVPAAPTVEVRGTISVSAIEVSPMSAIEVHR